MDWDELRRLAESLPGRGLVEEMNRQSDLLSGAALSRQVLDDLAAGALAQRLPSESLATIAEQVARARHPWLELSGRAGSLPELNGAGELARTLDARLRLSREQFEAQVATFQWLAAGLGGADGPHRPNLASVEPAGALALFKASESLFGSFRTLAEEVASVDAAGVDSAILDLPPLRVASQHGFSRRMSLEPSERGGGDEGPDEGVVAELLELELTGRLDEELPARLAEVDPELPRLWAGARQALRSNDADRVRHASVSVRELLDHTLRRLAPDEKIARLESGTEAQVPRPLHPRGAPRVPGPRRSVRRLRGLHEEEPPRRTGGRGPAPGRHPLARGALR